MATKMNDLRNLVLTCMTMVITLRSHYKLPRTMVAVRSMEMYAKGIEGGMLPNLVPQMSITDATHHLHDLHHAAKMHPEYIMDHELDFHPQAALNLVDAGLNGMKPAPKGKVTPSLVAAWLKRHGKLSAKMKASADANGVDWRSIWAKHGGYSNTAIVDEAIRECEASANAPQTNKIDWEQYIMNDTPKGHNDWVAMHNAVSCLRDGIPMDYPTLTKATKGWMQRIMDRHNAAMKGERTLPDGAIQKGAWITYRGLAFQGESEFWGWLDRQ